MRRFKDAASFVAMVLVVLGLSGPAHAGDKVPFKGTMDGTLVTRVPLDPPFFLATFAITGNATQLGKYDLLITAVADPQAMTAEGTYEFVAANGDTLTADFIGMGIPTDTPGVVLQVEMATITGGTGRFAGASGSIQVERLFDRNTGIAVGEFTGTISSRGKN